jgi:hypothetical protein
VLDRAQGLTARLFRDCAAAYDSARPGIEAWARKSAGRPTPVGKTPPLFYMIQ